MCFNPRTRAECDQREQGRPVCRYGFNPRTRAECDARLYSSKAFTISFQSTHSRGVRPRHICAGFAPEPVSIHALARSATRTAKHTDVFIAFQSTHSRGVRRISIWVAESLVMFQSTHSRGVRPNLEGKGCALSSVSIHALARSATSFSSVIVSVVKCFNPRTRAECDSRSAGGP